MPFCLSFAAKTKPTDKENVMKKPVIMTAREACGHIRDGDVIVNTGMLLAANSEAVLTAMEESFLQTGHPNGLTLMHSSSQSDRVGGIEHLAHPGMVDRMIGSHWGLAPKWMRCIADNEICAYNIPQGQMTHLLRSMACGEYGNVTKVGLGTFIDPRMEGGKMNEKARQREDIYEVVMLGGEEYLHYKPILPDVALIRGTSMDEDGNLSVEEEGVKLELLTAALAVKRNGGRVIAQIKRFVKNGSIHPQRVVVPGVFIDIAVPCTDPEKDHRQCSSIVYSPAVCGDGKEELSAHSGAAASAGSPDIRFLIGRRAAMELHEDDVINMGIGIPNDTIGVILEQEGLNGFAVPTVESGIYGGVALGGADFGVGKNCTAIIPHEQQFDFYDGRGVDVCFMGVGEIDRFGNVNSTKMGKQVAGAGGFIDITSNAGCVVFCTTFTAKGLDCEIGEGGVQIYAEGKIRKFVERVSQVSFNGQLAVQRKQRVVVVTERAVFRLTENGWLLTELAPGIDLERDVLANMDFAPMVAPELRRMDPRLYKPAPFGLRDILRNETEKE